MWQSLLKLWVLTDCYFDSHVLFCMAMCLRVLIAECCHCLHIKHFICLYLLMKVIYVVILWLLCWQHMCHIYNKLKAYSQVFRL